MQGKGVAVGNTSAFLFLIFLSVRCSPSRPRSPSVSCTLNPPSPRRHAENYCSSVPLAERRFQALRLVALPLRHLLTTWLAPLLRETSRWTLRRSTSTCRPSPAAAMALSFLQLVRMGGEAGREVGTVRVGCHVASPALPLSLPSPSITRVSCGP